MTVRDQLASCWDFISGCGTRADSYGLWVCRRGRWLLYATFAGVDEVGRLQTGDEVQMYLTKACTLSYGKKKWELQEGWNTIRWEEFPKAEIVGFLAPSEASEGEQFTVEAEIKNSGDTPGYIGCTADWNGNAWDGGYVDLDLGQTHTWSIGITMPGKDLFGKVYAWSWNGSEWFCDHVKEFKVKLKVPAGLPIEEAIQIVGVGLRAEG